MLRHFHHSHYPKFLSCSSFGVLRHSSLEDAQVRHTQDAQEGHSQSVQKARHLLLETAVNRLERREIQGDSYTYASLLHRCIDARALPEGKRVHAHIISSGYDRGTFIGNLLVQMYGDCGSLEDARIAFEKILERNVFSGTLMLRAYAQNGHLQDARDVFEEMTERNVVSWNCMIAAYAQNGYGNEALESFQRMNLEGMKADKVTFLSIMDACAGIETGKLIHACIVDGGFEGDIMLGNALVNMFGKCGSLEDARGMFEKVPARTVVSWNAMVAAYAQNGLLRDARRIFEEMPELDVVSYNSMITAYAQNGQSLLALHLFRVMNLLGVKPNEVTLLSIFYAFASLEDVAEGKVIHAIITQSGLHLDVPVENALLNMYGKCGSLNDAKGLFDKMAQLTVVSWTAMISAYAKAGHLDDARRVFNSMPEQNEISWTTMVGAYTQNGYADEALHLFWRMNLEGIRPDKITFVSILNACSSSAAFGDGKKIHDCIVNAGLQSDVAVQTSLVNMYGKYGSLEDARRVFEEMPEKNVVSSTSMIVGYAQKGLLQDARFTFDGMPHRDVVSWNAMIAAYAQNGYGGYAHKLFHHMLLEHGKPDKTTFLCIFDACGSLAALDYGKFVHAGIVDAGLEADDTVANALTVMYGRCGSVDYARRVFERMPRPSVVSCTAMIAAYAQNGRLQNARNVFDDMPHRDVVTWNSMVAAYAQNGQCTDALQLFHQMAVEGVKPDMATFATILDACTSMLALKEGKRIHNCIIDGGMQLDAVLGNALVNLYGKCGCLADAEQVFEKMPRQSVASWNGMIAVYAQSGYIQDARQLFDRMPERDVVSFNAMIAAYAQNGHAGAALKLSVEMDLDGLKPDRLTFVSVLDACANLGDVTNGRIIHTSIIEQGLQSDVVVGTALVNLYGKSGNLEDASLVFEEMPEKNVVTWSTIVAAYSQHGHGKLALSFVPRMILEGVKPDRICFVSILSACSHAGLMKQGHEYFWSMEEDHGVAASVDHYVCMIDLLGRAGQLVKAEDLIKNMPWKSNSVAWMTFLAACKMHGDAARGAQAAKQISKMDPKGASSYVLLSNMHAGFDATTAIDRNSS